MRRIGIVLILSLLFTSCGPPCLKGHDVITHHPTFCSSRVVHTLEIGEVSIPIYGMVCDPPYDSKIFICDEYEAEKLPK